MKKTSCHRIITTSETLQGLISGVQKEFSTENPQFELLINNIPSIQQVYPKLGAEVANDPFTPYPASENPPSLTDTAVYIHSSGSTGLPKAIPITHQMYLEWMSFGTFVTSALLV
jgi:acyl-coenzyme A synthetase/AMP-(fatty) acid ligase